MPSWTSHSIEIATSLSGAANAARRGSSFSEHPPCASHINRTNGMNNSRLTFFYHSCIRPKCLCTTSIAKPFHHHHRTSGWNILTVGMNASRSTFLYHSYIRPKCLCTTSITKAFHHHHRTSVGNKWTARKASPSQKHLLCLCHHERIPPARRIHRNLGCSPHKCFSAATSAPCEPAKHAAAGAPCEPIQSSLPHQQQFFEPAGCRCKRRSRPLPAERRPFSCCTDNQNLQLGRAVLKLPTVLAVVGSPPPAIHLTAASTCLC